MPRVASGPGGVRPSAAWPSSPGRRQRRIIRLVSAWHRTLRRHAPTTDRTVSLPKRNYGFEKRQKELAKQQKRQEKANRKLAEREAPQAEDGIDDTDTTPAPDEP